VQVPHSLGFGEGGDGGGTGEGGDGGGTGGAGAGGVGLGEGDGGTGFEPQVMEPLLVVLSKRTFVPDWNSRVQTPSLPLTPSASGLPSG